MVPGAVPLIGAWMTGDPGAYWRPLPPSDPVRAFDKAFGRMNARKQVPIVLKRAP